MKSGITHLVIKQKKIPTLFDRKSMNTPTSVNEILIGRKQNPNESFHLFENLQRSGQIDFSYETFLGFSRKLKIPKNIENGLVAYFQKHKSIIYNDDDCKDFIESIYGVRMQDLMEKTELHFSLKKIQPGDILLIMDINERTQYCGFIDGKFHYAAYLGKDFYISKMGQNGSINICSLEDIKKHYSYSHCLVIPIKSEEGV